VARLTFAHGEVFWPRALVSGKGVQIMWVLIIVLIGNSGVPATTTIPGYTTKAECESAGAQIRRFPDVLHMPQTQCLPGPGVC
jgi:hypothetical protein